MLYGSSKENPEDIREGYSHNEEVSDVKSFREDRVKTMYFVVGRSTRVL